LALFYQHNINETTRLGIWKIQEPEEFFTQKVPLQRTITHPHKRLQHLAGRWLLQYLFIDFPYEEIVIAGTRKPYLPGEKYHFSISHTGNYAAAIVSSTQRVGIDIEFVSPKIQSIAHKFMPPGDYAFIEASQLNLPPEQMLAFMWSAKETLLKWYSLGNVDFKEDLQLNGAITKVNVGLQMPFSCKKQDVKVNTQLFEELNLVLGWATT